MTLSTYYLDWKLLTFIIKGDTVSMYTDVPNCIMQYCEGNTKAVVKRLPHQRGIGGVDTVRKEEDPVEFVVFLVQGGVVPLQLDQVCSLH